MARIHELHAKRDALVTQANAALEAVQKLAQSESRTLTADELKAQDAFDDQIKALDQEIALEQRKLDRERNAGRAPRENANRNANQDARPGTRVTDIRQRSEGDRAHGFADHRDFLLAVMNNAGLRDRAELDDERLAPLAIVDEDRRANGELAFALPRAFAPRAAAGSDEQGAYSDPYGGYAVPTTRLPGMLQVDFEGDPLAGRTQMVPMQSPSIEILARTDKNHTSSVSGGLTVSRRAETTAPSPTRMEMEMVTMKAAMLIGLSYATEEILTDSPLSFATILDAGYRQEFAANHINECIRGAGGNEFLGALNSPALVTVSKESGQANDTIVALNVINMAARCWGFGNAVWLANHDTRPQLATLSIATGSASGVLLYQPSRGEGFPDMLWGRPVFYTEFASKLGDLGDLILGNWTQFLEGEYQPIQSADSMHVRFVNHERAFKFWKRNAGAPWWKAALTPKKSTATLSPFVTLEAR